MKVKEYLEKLLPGWKIVEKEPNFLRFERDRCAYTVDLGFNQKISSKALCEIAGKVISHYGAHLLDYKEEKIER